MLITTESTKPYVKREAGGKGYNLYLLTKEGFPVPNWIIISASLFKNFRTQNDLDKSINTALIPLRTNNNTRTNVSSISQSIKQIILNTPLDPGTSNEIKKAYKSLKAKSIAVRSSGLDEDSSSYSFAGQFDSYLFIRSESDALQALKKCWASAYSERNISYRIQNKLSLDSEEINVAVIFQQMIDADTSGVLFTCDPIKHDNSSFKSSISFCIAD